MADITIDGVTFSYELAEIASSISEEEWAYMALKNSISDQIAAYMETKGIARVALAERMETSRAFVTKVLAGDANMTLKTLTKILHHLDARPEVKIVAKNDQFQWFGLVTEKKCVLEVRPETTKQEPCTHWQDFFQKELSAAA